MDLLQSYESDEGRPEAKRRKSTAYRGAESSGVQKIRSFPHVEGNYAVHTCITVPVPVEVQSTLKDVLSKASHAVPDLQTGLDCLPENNKSVTDLPATYHLSLSRATAIRHQDRDSLLSVLRDSLAKLKRFHIDFSNLEAFINDERTRTFLSISVGDGRMKVCKAVKRIDRAYIQHGLPQFYKDPKPHISLAWVVGDRLDAVGQHVAEANAAHLGRGLAGREVLWRHEVKSVICRIGEKVFTVWECTDGAAEAKSKG